MENWVKDGYNHARKNVSAQYGSDVGDQYIHRINDAIQQFNDDINRFQGYETSSAQLKGDVAEFWHGNTFNINAAVNDSNYRVYVDRSHDYASADIKSNWGEDYGLKYYGSAEASAAEQAKSHFQKFCEYRQQSGNENITIEEFLSKRGYDNDKILYDPIYSGQMRLIPVDQYNAAVEYLKWKIAKEELTRPEQVKRYKETLEMLTTKVKAPDGTQSVELTKDAATRLAELAKEGKFDASDYGFSTEELVRFHHALQQGIKAGTSAAIISLILKVAPEFYKCLEKLIVEGKINEDDLRRIGFAALHGAGEGFLRGFVAGTITTACESGMLGSALKNVNPGSVAALTVILLQSMKDSYLVVKGEMTQYELTANISKNVFVTSCGIGLGALVQTLIPAMPFAYMLGNFVGSFVGSFAYVACDSAFMSFATYSGWTFFGLVDQDYVLPDEVVREIGIDVFDYDKFYFDSYQIDEYKPDYFDFDEYTPHFIKLLRRGVIGVHQVGFIYD